MIAASRSIPGYAARHPDVIGEETLAKALSRLWPAVAYLLSRWPTKPQIEGLKAAMDTAKQIHLRCRPGSSR
jgi:hypothetical protein